MISFWATKRAQDPAAFPKVNKILRVACDERGKVGIRRRPAAAVRSTFPRSGERLLHASSVASVRRTHPRARRRWSCAAAQSSFCLWSHSTLTILTAFLDGFSCKRPYARRSGLEPSVRNERARHRAHFRIAKSDWRDHMRSRATRKSWLKALSVRFQALIWMMSCAAGRFFQYE